MITIQNMHDHKPKEPYDIKVDRTSILGCPYYLKDESLRDNVCDSYQVWFDKCLNSPVGQRTTFKQEMDRLFQLHDHYGKLNLFCWCSPKRCHAETIKSSLEQVIKSQQSEEKEND